MKGVALSAFGAEELLSQELSELGAIDCKAHKGAVVFDISSYEDIASLAYKTQIAERMVVLLSEFSFQNEEDAKKLEVSEQIKEFFANGSTFRVTCVKRGEHMLSSVDCEIAIGGQVKVRLDGMGISVKVNLDAPDVPLLALVVDGYCYLGVDLYGFDASKRDYKIFITPSSIKGTTASAILRFSGYEKKHELLDPFVGDGTLVIEAGLYASKKSPYHYKKEHFVFRKLLPFQSMDMEKFFSGLDKKISTDGLPIAGFDSAFKNIDYARKNAKIAGVEKLMYLSRVTSEWLDLKFDKHDVDRIVTRFPDPSIKLPESMVAKLRKDFFYQAEYILTPKGKAVVLCKDLTPLMPYAKEFKFSLEKEQELWTGEQRMVLGMFSKEK